MEKSFLIDQIWSNRAVLKYKDSKTNLGTLEVSELESMYALIPTTNATQEPDATVQTDAPSAFSPEIGTVKTTKGVEIPVVFLPLAKVSGMSLYFQFGEEQVIISNIEYVRIFKKGLIQLGQSMPFNYSLGVNSFRRGLAGYLTPLAQSMTAQERTNLSAEEMIAGKLLTSFVEGFASEQAIAKDRATELALVQAEAVKGLKGEARKRMEEAMLNKVVEARFASVSSRLEDLLKY